MKRQFLIILLAVLGLQLQGQVEFSDEAGVYGEMLEDLKSGLYEKRVRTMHLDGRDRLMFVSWIRDHIHVMKAFKYWEEDLESFLDFFIGRQTPKGMFFDFSMGYEHQNVGHLHFTNVFDNQWYYVDVINQRFFWRMPITADLEYLFLEGANTYWQASGDSTKILDWLPSLTRGMRYAMSDPLRWSPEHFLVKRPYSIDTWDFTSEPDSLKDNARLIYHIGNDELTPKGIMHGDNSGMVQACRQLGNFYGLAGNKQQAEEWTKQGELLQHRVNTLLWNGKHYLHFLPIDPVPAHIDSDPATALSLSNTYTMNRDVPSREMAASIIESYREVAEKTKDFSPAAWYGIYPFIEPQFGKYKVGEYMNGALLPLLGGELAKAAFRNGYERFAVEQLETAISIMKKNDGTLPGCVNWDGTVQAEEVPDEWGQAAFVSALVEGLAGVVDQDILFREVEISPRWYFADIDEVSVGVGYGNKGNRVNYLYQFDPKKDIIRVETSGDFKSFTLRVPQPQGAHDVHATLNGKPTELQIDHVNGSSYMLIRGTGSENVVEFKLIEEKK